MAKIFHVLTPNEKNKNIRNNIYRPTSLEDDGFIHFSKADQIETVIANFYSECQELILWRVSESKLDDKLAYEAPLEAPNSGIKFPHYYKELDMSFIEATFFLKPIDGKFTLPTDLID